MALPTPQQQADIAAIYAAFWERAPDPEGFGYWVDLYANGMALDTIADAFRDLPEGQAAYPIYQTGAQFVAQVYENVFNREPDAAGAAYWLNLLTTGGYTEGQLVTLMVDSAVAQAATGNTDGLLFQNKTYIGNWTVQNVLNGNVTPEQEAVITTNAFRWVSAEASSVVDAQIQISRLPTGTPYDLTINQDVFNGVAGNDLFISNLVANSSGAQVSTITQGDRLNGGDGWDTFDATLNGTIASGVFTLQNVESVELSVTGTASGITNSFSGVEVIQFEDTSGYNLTATASNAVDVASVYNVDNATFTLNTGTAATQDLVLDTANTVDVQLNNNGSDVLNIDAIGGVSSNITVGGEVSVATEINIDAIANLSFAGLTFANLTDLTIAGTADVTAAGVGVQLSNAATSGITVDATTATGDVVLEIANAGGVSLVADFGIGNDLFDITANVAAGASLVDVNMGAGNDTLAINYSLPGATNVTLDGGLGVDDTLAVYGVISSAQLEEIDFNYSTVRGFETLEIVSAHVSLEGGSAVMSLSPAFDLVEFNESVSFGSLGSLSLVNTGTDLDVTFDAIVSNGTAAANFDFAVDANGALDINFNDTAIIEAGISAANDWTFANADTLTFNIADTINSDDVVLEFVNGASPGEVTASFFADEVVTIDITGGSVASSFTFDLSGADGTYSDLTALTTIDVTGFNGTVSLDLSSDAIDNDLSILLSDGVAGAADTYNIATITGSAQGEDYVFASELGGEVEIFQFANLHGAENGDQLDVFALGVTNINQLVITAGSSANDWAITSSLYEGVITVHTTQVGGLTERDFIFS